MGWTWAHWAIAVYILHISYFAFSAACEAYVERDRRGLITVMAVLTVEVAVLILSVNHLSPW